jgi:hypothetical protein
MARDFPESDWKVFRRLREVALERFCGRVLEDARIVASKQGSRHERYLEVYRLIDRKDDELARAFNDSRRSNATVQLALIRAHGLLTEEEIAAFTAQTRQSVESLLAIMRGAKNR